jgi:putative tryptophan/tyrosine transport system substrate-binding protein
MLEDTTMTRRIVGLFVILALGLLVTLLTAEAQPAAHVPRLGLLIPSSFAAVASRIGAFRHGLRDLGYVEGRTITLEYRFADGQADRLPALVAELIRLPVDILVIEGTTAIRAAQHATTTIPVVMAVSGDPVGEGLIASLARPGGNITGLSSRAPEVSGKRLELLKEAVPHLSRVAALWHRDAPVGPYVKETQAAAQALGLQRQALEVGSPDALDQAFAAMTRAHADALVVLPSAQFFNDQRVVAELAMTHRLPTMFGQREAAAAGGPISYGPHYAEFYRRAATYVDKILKGATPADLPVEQTMKFELVINLKTAQALGLTIPPTLLFQADEVIR